MQRSGDLPISSRDLNGEIRITAGEIEFQGLLARAGVASGFGKQDVQIGNDDRIDDGGARRFEFLDVLQEYRINFLEVLGIRLGICADRFVKNADACSFQSILVEIPGEAAADFADPEGGDGILRIVSDHAVEQNCEVANVFSAIGPICARGEG